MFMVKFKQRPIFVPLRDQVSGSQRLIITESPFIAQVLRAFLFGILMDTVLLVVLLNSQTCTSTTS